MFYPEPEVGEVALLQDTFTKVKAKSTIFQNVTQANVTE